MSFTCVCIYTHGVRMHTHVAMPTYPVFIKLKCQILSDSWMLDGCICVWVTLLQGHYLWLWPYLFIFEFFMQNQQVHYLCCGVLIFIFFSFMTRSCKAVLLALINVLVIYKVQAPRNWDSSRMKLVHWFPSVNSIVCASYTRKLNIISSLFYELSQ